LTRKHNNLPFTINATVVAANRDARALLPLLSKRSGDEDPVIGEHAAWALRQLGRE